MAEPPSSAVGPPGGGGRSVLKGLANALATLVVLPAYGLYRLGRPVLGPVKAFQGWSQALALVPGLAGVYLRRAFYRLTLLACSPDVGVGFGTLITRPDARLGHGVFTGAFCCLGGVVLEDDVLLGSHVSITSGSRQHGIDRLDVPIRYQPGVEQTVLVGRDTWIGERAVVMADVGRHCVVAAGSVVVRPVPDYAIVAGVPAQVVRYRNAPTTAEAEENASCPTVVPPSASSC